MNNFDRFAIARREIRKAHARRIRALLDEQDPLGTLTARQYDRAPNIFPEDTTRAELRAYVLAQTEQEPNYA